MKMPVVVDRRLLARAIRRDWMLALLLVPAIVYFLVFHYAPMYGLVIAFKRYYVSRGIWGSPWVGLQWFRQFFQSVYFVRLMRNTLLVSVYSIVFGFPVPIVFALVLNEIRNNRYKRVIQTISYLPHFISTVVVVAIMQMLLSMQDGVINELLSKLGGEKINFLMEPRWFRSLYIGSGIWQQYGWSSIIYLAAITGVDLSLYEAAYMDGSTRWKNVWYITLPCIFPTIGILLILRIGNIMSVGFEKIILMYNERTYVVADVISTYTYRRGILNADYGFATAVGLFNSVINLVVLISANRISRRLMEVSLW